MARAGRMKLTMMQAALGALLLTAAGAAAQENPAGTAGGQSVIVLPDGEECRPSAAPRQWECEGGSLRDVTIDGLDLTAMRHNDGDAQRLSAPIESVTLDDGAVCLALAGAAPAIDALRFNFSCRTAGVAGLIGAIWEEDGLFWTEALIIAEDGLDAEGAIPVALLRVDLGASL